MRISITDATGTMRSLNFSTCVLIWTYTTVTERSHCAVPLYFLKEFQ
ncbi:hypothetical protein [Nostoc sp. UHCC 0251]|nr:hypothetical protein [Nostoc sp. UHCC 0251]MEA5621841.1 hypothetical protein [Nostoc sp. UHCC 0251]